MGVKKRVVYKAEQLPRPIKDENPEALKVSSKLHLKKHEGVDVLCSVDQ